MSTQQRLTCHLTLFSFFHARLHASLALIGFAADFDLNSLTFFREEWQAFMAAVVGRCLSGAGMARHFIAFFIDIGARAAGIFSFFSNPITFRSGS